MAALLHRCGRRDCIRTARRKPEQSACDDDDRSTHATCATCVTCATCATCATYATYTTYATCATYATYTTCVTVGFHAGMVLAISADI